MRLGIDNEGVCPIVAKAIQKKFYLEDHLSKLVEPIKKQFKSSISYNLFARDMDLKWRGVFNNNVLTEAIQEDLTSIINSRQKEVENEDCYGW